MVRYLGKLSHIRMLRDTFIVINFTLHLLRSVIAKMFNRMIKIACMHELYFIVIYVYILYPLSMG